MTPKQKAIIAYKADAIAAQWCDQYKGKTGATMRCRGCYLTAAIRRGDYKAMQKAIKAWGKK